MWGGKRYVKNVCMYAALFRASSGIVTQTARRRESVPKAHVWSVSTDRYSALGQEQAAYQTWVLHILALAWFCGGPLQGAGGAFGGRTRCSTATSPEPPHGTHSKAHDFAAIGDWSTGDWAQPG